MARHRTTTVEHYHSDDPRQLDLERFIEQKAGEVPSTAGRPAAEADLQIPFECVFCHQSVAGDPEEHVCPPDSADDPSQIQAQEPPGGDVDALAREVVEVTGFTPSLSWSLPGSSPASRLVRIGWDSVVRALRDGEGTGRLGFFASSGEALRHVIEYERIDARWGRASAEGFHAGARCRTEAEAVAAMDERAGVDRPDPNRGDRRFINDHHGHNRNTKEGSSRWIPAWEKAVEEAQKPR